MNLAQALSGKLLGQRAELLAGRVGHGNELWQARADLQLDHARVIAPVDSSGSLGAGVDVIPLSALPDFGT